MLYQHHQSKLVLLILFLNWDIYRVAHCSSTPSSIHLIHDVIPDENLLDLDEESQTEFEHMKNAVRATSAINDTIYSKRNNVNDNANGNEKANKIVNENANTNNNRLIIDHMNSQRSNSTATLIRTTATTMRTMTTTASATSISTSIPTKNKSSSLNGPQPFRKMVNAIRMETDPKSSLMKTPLKKSSNTLNNRKDNNNNAYKSSLISSTKYTNNDLDAHMNKDDDDHDDDEEEFYDDDNYNYDDENDDDSDEIYNYNDDDLSSTMLTKSKVKTNKNKPISNPNNIFKLKPIKGDNNHISSNTKTGATSTSVHVRNDRNKEANKIAIDNYNDDDNDENKKLKNDWINYDNEDDDDDDMDDDHVDDDDDDNGDRDDDENDNDFDNDTDGDGINDINDEEDIVFSQSTVCPRYCTCERNANNYLVAYCNRIDPDTQKFGKDITDLVVTDVSPKYPILLGPKFFYKLGLKFISSIKMANCSIEYLHLQAFHGLDELYSVNLTNVGLAIMNPTTFATNKKLRLLTISGNDLSVMSSVPYLVQSASLEELDLSRNNLMELNPHALTQLKNIIYINLSQNNLQKIPENVFDKLKTLEELDLSYNSLKKLPSNLFNRTSLAILHLKYNSITDDLRFGTKDLQQLDLSFNQIHQIHQGMFENMTGLTTLHLKGNGLTRIQSNAFFTLHQLRHIDLSINELDQISSMLFYKNTDLNVVRLNDNPRLSRLPTDGLRSHNGVFTIYYLDISNCAIGALGFKTFSTMPHLATLKLAWNNINNLEPDTFTTLHKLTDLDLSNNLIVKLDDMIFMNNNDLMKLNLAGNPIHKLSIRLFLPLNKLRELDVSDCELDELLSDVQYGVGGRYKFYETLRTFNVSANQIHKITAEHIRHFKNLYSLDISNNPLKCNEGFQQFIAYVSLNGNIQPYKIPTMEPLLHKLYNVKKNMKNGMKGGPMKVFNTDNGKLEAEVGWSALAHEVCKHQDPSWMYKHNKNNNNNNNNKKDNNNNKNKKKKYYNLKSKNDLNDDYIINSIDADDNNQKERDDVDVFKNHKILRDRINDKKNRKLTKQQLLDELTSDDDNRNDNNTNNSNTNDNVNVNDDDNNDGENMPENTNTENFNDDETENENGSEEDDASDDDDDDDEDDDDNIDDDEEGDVDEDEDEKDDDEADEGNDNVNDANSETDAVEDEDYMNYRKKAKIPKKFKDHNDNIDVLRETAPQDQYLLNKFLNQHNENNRPRTEQRNHNYNNNENIDNMNRKESEEFIIEHGRIYYNGYRFMIPVIIIITSVLLLLLIISKVIFMIMHKRGERYRMSLLQAHKNSIVYQRLSEDIKTPMNNTFNNYHHHHNSNNSNNTNTNKNANNHKQPKVHQYAPISQV